MKCLEVKEAFFQEERQHQAGRIKEYVNEVEKLQEEKAKIESEKEEAIEQVKTEIENKVNERLTHHDKELAIERTKLNAKDKHLRKVYRQYYALNKELYQMKEQCESKALELEAKEAFFQEEREHQAGRMKEYVNEVEKLQEEKAKIESEKEKAIEQVKTEIENKVNERLTHHDKEFAIERTKLNAKDKHLRKVYRQCYALKIPRIKRKTRVSNIT